MTLLPLHGDPADGEAWDSYLTRRARQHACSQATLADHIGLRTHNRWPPFHGVVLDRERTHRAAEGLGIEPAAVQAMHLSTYDGVAADLTGLLADPTIRQARLVAQRGWIYLAGSNFCPACLRIDGVWKLTWRLPWITACTRHSTRLDSTCPACGAFPRTGREQPTSGPSPSRNVPDPKQCGHRAANAKNACNADLSEAPTKPAGPAEVARARAFELMFATRITTIHGRQASALDAVRAWQTAICYAAYFHDHQPDGNSWGGTHRWRTPPRSTDLMARLQAAAEPLVMAHDQDTAAGVLNGWARGRNARPPAPGDFADAAPASNLLQPVIAELLTRDGRTHSLINRRAARERPTKSAARALRTVDDIPQIAWPCALPLALRESTKPNTLLLRAVLAIIVARIVLDRPWGECGSALGWPAGRARQWTRYCFSRQHPRIKQQLVTAAFLLSRRLDEQSVQDMWSQRPVIFGSTSTAVSRAQQPACSSLAGSEPWCPCK